MNIRQHSVIILAALISCSDDSSLQSDFSEYFADAESWSLQETPTVITVAPFITADPRGGYFVTDAKEAQFRRYAVDGRLIKAVGKAGKGPGEFKTPVVARRLLSGDILVADLGLGLSVFDSTGDTFRRRQSLGPLPIFGLLPLDDERVLLIGQSSRTGSPTLLHVFNLSHGDVERSFFEVPGFARYPRAATFMPWAAAALRGDTIAAVYTLADTIFFFTTDGRALRKMPIPFAHFDMIREDLPANQSTAREAAARVSRITDVHWLADGSFVVQYMNRAGTAETWRLLRMYSDGARAFELVDTPRLLVVRDSIFVFQDLDSLSPADLMTARLK